MGAVPLDTKDRKGRDKKLQYAFFCSIASGRPEVLREISCSASHASSLWKSWEQMSSNRDIHARACTRWASTNRWKKFVDNLHSMHLLATVRDRSCTRKRSGRVSRVWEETTPRKKKSNVEQGSENVARFSKRNEWGARKRAIERKRERKCRKRECA